MKTRTFAPVSSVHSIIEVRHIHIKSNFIKFNFFIILCQI